MRICVQQRIVTHCPPSHCCLASLVQVSSNASTGEGPSAAVDDHNARVINMLRGGILYVKIRKSMDMEEDGKGDLPSSARQVRTKTHTVPSVWSLALAQQVSLACASPGPRIACKEAAMVAMRHLKQSRRAITDGRCDNCTEDWS